MSASTLLTFEQFRATGALAVNLNDVAWIDDEALVGKPGRIYAGGECYIEREPDGRWMCTVFGDGIIDADLVTVERFLYDSFYVGQHS